MKKAETKAALESMLEAVLDTKTYLARLRENPAKTLIELEETFRLGREVLLK